MPDAIPPVRGRVGRPRRKPDSLFADRGYDIKRDQVRACGIVPAIARRATLHGTGLGTYRWVAERSFAWLHRFRHLRIRWERRADIHESVPQTRLLPHHPPTTRLSVLAVVSPHLQDFSYCKIIMVKVPTGTRLRPPTVRLPP